MPASFTTSGYQRDLTATTSKSPLGPPGVLPTTTPLETERASPPERLGTSRPAINVQVNTAFKPTTMAAHTRPTSTLHIAFQNVNPADKTGNRHLAQARSPPDNDLPFEDEHDRDDSMENGGDDRQLSTSLLSSIYSLTNIW